MSSLERVVSAYYRNAVRSLSPERLTRMASSVVYLGVFLTPESKRRLLSAFPAIHPTVFAEHTTVIFKPSEADVRAFPVGEEVKLHVIGYAHDDRGQAVLIRPEGVTINKPNPHITISCASNTKPVYSNELLAAGHEPAQHLVLEGIADTFPRS